MRIAILNFGKELPRYLPMLELFIADALSKRNIDSKIYTVMHNDSYNDFAKKFNKYNPDYYLVWETTMSKATTYILKMVDFVSILKQNSNSSVVMGGYWAMTYGDVYSEFNRADFFINGFNIDKIADGFKDRKLDCQDNIDATGECNWDKFNLDLKYLVDPSIYFDSRLKYVSGYLGTMGCPYSCGFCFNTVLKDFGVKYSERSLEKVKKDMRLLTDFYDFKSIQFKDLNFFHNWKRAFKIAEYLKQNNQTLGGFLDITISDATEEMFKLFKEYNITELYYGLESLDNEHRILMNKYYTNEKLEQVFMWADKYKIKLVGNIILGFPWQDKTYIEESIKKVVYYTNKYDHVLIIFNTFIPIFKTKIQEKYFPNITSKFTFKELVDIYSYNLRYDGLQELVFGEKFDFIELDRLMNVFLLVYDLQRFRLKKYKIGDKTLAWFIRKLQSQFEKEPYLRNSIIRKYSGLSWSKRNFISKLIQYILPFLQIHLYVKYFKTYILRQKND